MPIYKINTAQILIQISLQKCKDPIAWSFQWTKCSIWILDCFMNIAFGDTAFPQKALQYICRRDNPLCNYCNRHIRYMEILYAAADHLITFQSDCLKQLQKSSHTAKQQRPREGLEAMSGVNASVIETGKCRVRQLYLSNQIHCRGAHSLRKGCTGNVNDKYLTRLRVRRKRTSLRRF